MEYSQIIFKHSIKKDASEGFEPSPPGHEPEVHSPSHLLAYKLPRVEIFDARFYE
jgi:hypothetical protein